MIGRPGFREWFDGGVFLNPDGTPMTFYHGTDTGADFNIFARTDESSIGFHFGDLGAAHKRIDSMQFDEFSGAVIPVFCNAANPLRLTDHHTWSQRNVCGELYDLGILNDDQYDMVVGSYDEYAIFAAIELAGYDSVVYTNETEHAGTPADSVIVWRAEMVKGVYASRFEVGEPGLVPDVPHDPDDYECWETVPDAISGYRDKLLALAPRPRMPVPA